MAGAAAELTKALKDAGTDEDSAIERLCWMSRRRFLRLSAGAIAALGLPSFGLTACTEEQLEELLEKIRNRPVRRDISTLAATDPILESYRAAISAMQALPSSNPRSWAAQAAIHGSAGSFNTCAHANWHFLTWHRAYLYFFERICRKLSNDDSFALPYWNWTDNPQVPAVFWTQGDPLFHSPRGATPSSTANPAIVGSGNVSQILNETNFELFAGGAVGCDVSHTTRAWKAALESGPHDYIHGTFVRGTMGQGNSPLDPIFWTHHNRIDELWVEWNILRGNPNTNDSDWTCRSFDDFVNGDGNAESISVPVLLLLPLLSYRFDTQVP